MGVAGKDDRCDGVDKCVSSISVFISNSRYTHTHTSTHASAHQNSFLPAWAPLHHYLSGSGDSKLPANQSVNRSVSHAVGHSCCHIGIEPTQLWIESSRLHVESSYYTRIRGTASVWLRVRALLFYAVRLALIDTTCKLASPITSPVLCGAQLLLVKLACQSVRGVARCDDDGQSPGSSRRSDTLLTLWDEFSWEVQAKTRFREGFHYPHLNADDSIRLVYSIRRTSNRSN